MENENYDALFHNCHDFVRFCLYVVGANDDTIKNYYLFLDHINKKINTKKHKILKNR